MKLKNIVYNRRTELGLSKAQLAERCNIDKTVIEDIEKGRIRGFRYLYQLLVGLEITREKYFKANPEQYPLVNADIALLLEQSDVSHIEFVRAIDDVELMSANRVHPLDQELKSKLVMACYTQSVEGLNAEKLADIFE